MKSLSFKEFKKAMDMVKEEAALQKRLSDPDFLKFYMADPEMEEILTFDEWKLVAVNDFPNGTGE